ELVHIVHRVEDVSEFVRHSRDSEAGGDAEVFNRSLELGEGLRKAESQNVAKREFLSRMSHELRTPLTSILGFGELLELSELDEDHHQGVELIVAAGRHLLELINDVLDLTRIESGHLSLSLEPVAVGAVAEATYDLLQPMAAGHRVTLEPPAGDATANF